MDHDDVSPGQIMTTAERYRSMFLAMTLTAPFILHPDKPLLDGYRAMTDTATGDTIPLRLGGRGDTEVALDLESVLDDVLTQDAREVTQDLLAVGMVTSVLTIGQLIDSGNLRYRDCGSPLLEFARHYRNACAHNRRWHFRADEPRNPARLRDLEITAEMNGQVAPNATVTPLDHLYFLDDLSAHFATMALRRAYDDVLPSAQGKRLDEIRVVLGEALVEYGVAFHQLRVNPVVYALLQDGVPECPPIRSRRYSK